MARECRSPIDASLATTGHTKSAGLKRDRAETLYEEVRAAVVRWRDFAAKAKLGADLAEKLRRTQRLELRTR